LNSESKDQKIATSEENQKVAKILLNLQSFLVDNINKANSYLLHEETENFEKQKIVYKTIQKCIDIITEMKS